MGIDPNTDVSILVLCYKLGAATAGQISKEVRTSKNSPGDTHSYTLHIACITVEECGAIM
jgi:hypothetical protein